MSNITINSHDILGKCTVIKNFLSVLINDPTVAQNHKDYMQKAYGANEEIIGMIKKIVEAKNHVLPKFGN